MVSYGGFYFILIISWCLEEGSIVTDFITQSPDANQFILTAKVAEQSVAPIFQFPLVRKLRLIGATSGRRLGASGQSLFVVKGYQRIN